MNTMISARWNPEHRRLRTLSFYAAELFYPCRKSSTRSIIALTERNGYLELSKTEPFRMIIASLYVIVEAFQ
jgi:hypothetical protein